MKRICLLIAILVGLSACTMAVTDRDGGIGGTGQSVEVET